MRTTRIRTLAAAAVIAAAALAAAAAPTQASEMVAVEGFGSTLAQAQAGAILYHNYYACTDLNYTDGNFADGTWWADIEATCQGDKVSG